MVVQIEQVDLAAGVVTDFGDGLFCIGEEFIFAVEDGDRFDAVQRGLNAEGGCRPPAPSTVIFLPMMSMLLL
ncbi:Uncharacterised protein [Klebsiella grimontii]|uniref:Uncharacterized protein n=1 Tax=Klebsiella grimontii TaxID=2058152 RepID=A0A7H4PAA0_9ENTR|nr:Uncharacterised protein [Klebsiella grimontii]